MFTFLALIFITVGLFFLAQSTLRNPRLLKHESAFGLAWLLLLAGYCLLAWSVIVWFIANLILVFIVLLLVGGIVFYLKRNDEKKSRSDMSLDEVEEALRRQTEGRGDLKIK